MSLASGTLLGPYQILACIGAGGMGDVYKAVDSRLGRTVAMKIIREPNEETRQRFQREASAISSLSHPLICRLYDVGEQGGIDYLVMDLEGETLAARLKKGPLTDLLRIGGQIAAALKAAHRHGLVHRDLKPANVMLTKAGAKLLDFGQNPSCKRAPPRVVTP
jgi:serine/threonine protein kinase